MRKGMFLIGIISILLTVGCSTLSRKVWTKDDFSQSEWNRDRYECSFNAQLLCRGYSTYYMYGMCMTSQQADCLNARGYYLVDE